MQAVKDAGRALTWPQFSAAPDWLRLCLAGSVTGRIWAMRDDYRARFAVLAEFRSSPSWCAVTRRRTGRSAEIEPCGYADNLFRASRRVHDIADATAGRDHQWPDESGSHRDRAATAEVMTKAFGDWYERRHDRE